MTAGHSRTTAHPERAPTLYAIIVFKLLKGALVLMLATVLYCDARGNLPKQYSHLEELLRIHPENKFFSRLAEQVGSLTEARVRWTAVGAFTWSFFPLVEGFGLMFRTTWAGWLAIGESAFFVPIEIFELEHHFSIYLTGVAISNIIIVWYLYANRDRLFHHVHYKKEITD